MQFAPGFVRCVAVVRILLHFEAPLHAGFLLSRPALDGLAAEARKDLAKACVFGKASRLDAPP